MKRTAIGLLTLILLGAPSTALAKVPWHSVEFVPASPVAGEPLTIVVRFWGDPRHTSPSNWWPDQSIGGVVAFDGPGGRVPLTLTRRGDGVYGAKVVLAEGTWTLLIDQRFSDATGPTHVDLATVTVRAAPVATGPISAAVIGIVLVATGAIWRGRRRSPSSIRPG